MCMRNVNINTLFCKDIETKQNGVYTVKDVFNFVVPKKDGSELLIDEFKILLFLNIVFDKDFNEEESKDKAQNKESTENIDFKLDTDYNICVRLTHSSTENSIDLLTFPLSVKKEELQMCGRKYFERKYIINVPKVNVQLGFADYAVKVLIKETNSTTGLYHVQHMSTLTVNMLDDENE